MRVLVLGSVLAGALILAGCASEPTVEAGTPTASSTPNPSAASKPVDHMPPEAKAAMEAGKARTSGAPNSGSR